MAENGWQWLTMSGNGWKWYEITVNGWKKLEGQEMSEHGLT